MEQQSRFQQAREQVMNMLNIGQQATPEDKQMVQEALQAAYQEATPEEKTELQQLENQLKNNQQL